MFDWNDLKCFLAVAREGSTLGAAKALGVNQTTVARRIEALEAALRLKLFERGQAGSSLTEAGRDLLAEAERMEAAAAGFAHRVEAHRRGLAGTLRVTATEILANTAVTPGLAAFRAAYPDVHVELLITDEILDIEAGEADLALRAGEVLAESNLVGRKVAEFPFALYASRDYLLRRGLPERIEDLSHHDLIAGDGVSEPLPGVRWMLERVPDAKPVARFNSMTSMLVALKSGMGVGPFGSLGADLEPELVRLFPIDLTTTGWIVTRRDLKDVPRVRAFIDFFVPHFAQLQRSLRSMGEAAQAERLTELRAAMASSRPG